MKKVVFIGSLALALAGGATELAAPDAEHAPETRKHQGIPSVAVSKVNGRMWCTYYCDPLGGENHLNYCVLATSADDGRSWREVLVADPDGAGLKRSFDPEVWIAPDGKLRWTWTERTLDPEKTDLKNTWNGYSNITSDTLHIAELDAENEPAAPYPSVRALMRGVMMCKPTVVRSGEWVFPLCEWGEAPSSKFYATRDGRTFRYLGGITLPKEWRQFDEQQMVELSDGRWWALVRTSFGLCESYSSDQGATWSEPVRSRLGHPNSRLFITKLPSGKLLLVKHGKIGEDPESGKWKVRKNLRAFVSSDDGKTWDGGLLLDARPGIAYPDGDVGKDGTIAVVYDHNRTKEKEILMARFTETDAYYAGNSSHRIELRRPVSRPTPVRKAEPLTLKLEEGEGWWGAATAFGAQMPFTAETTGFTRDLGKESWCNQTAPLLVSSKGRWVWCDEPFAFAFEKGMLTVVPSGTAKVETGRAGTTLRSAFLGAAKRFFPASGKLPDLVTIAAPQYNTWIELNYNQNQKDVMAYAKAIVENGLPPGLMAIDDTWQTDYGIWTFDAAKFPDPKGMCDELHKMGFKVELWLAPFVSADSRPYRYLRDTLKEGLLWEKRPNTACMVEWWNGTSAELDLTDPAGVKWLTDTLRGLQTKYGVDGFKFDAADLGFYKPEMCAYTEGATPADHCEAYARLGLAFPLNEYRACWKMAGQPLVQRLYDKKADWADVRQLIPDMIACGLLGHPFVCPDMIGGGLLWSFREGTVIDQEQFVRSAQVHALCPMMQFSAAPWRVLDKEHFAAVKSAVELRQRFVSRFLELAKESAKSGEPMLRSMEYQFPGSGYAAVKDQFVMGNFLLVAPQLVKGAMMRTVVIPEGKWTADDGTAVVGPKTVTVETPIGRIPHFVLCK